MRRCPIMIGTGAPCLSARMLNCSAILRNTSPLNPTKFTAAKPYRAENHISGSSGVSPSASACSINSLVRSAATLVSGAAYALTWMRGVMSADCSFNCCAAWLLKEEAYQSAQCLLAALLRV